MKRSLALCGLALLVSVGASVAGDARPQPPSATPTASPAPAAPRDGDDPSLAAAAADAPLPPPPDGERLLAIDALWTYVPLSTPPLPRQLGVAAVAALDLAAGRDVPALRAPASLPQRPPQWPLALPGTAARGKGPLGVARDGHPCDCATAVAPPGSRVAALLATSVINLRVLDARLLELRLRYRDGIAVWINGVEVMRRALSGAALSQLADRARGPEWETVYVPVVPGLLRLGENTVAVELRLAATSDAPELAFEIYARRDAHIARGPFVQSVAETSAIIVIETDVAVAATLSWGLDGALATSLARPAARRQVWELRGLPANRAISYRVTAGASLTPIYRFHTLPPPGSVIRIGVYGDVRGGHETHRTLTQALIDEAPDAVVVTGDMVLRGSDEGDWQRFFAVTAELLPRIPYYPAIGNHDLGRAGDTGRRANEIFELPPAPPGRPEGAYWYSADLSDVHLVFLDSNSYERPEQERWLEQDLAAARARRVRAIVAVTHDGPYSRGIHGGSPIARERYVPILTRYKVNLLLAGHDHQYMRGRIGGLDYMVSGGGGAALYPVTCGVPGRPRCKVQDGMRKVAKEHHYLMLTITTTTIELCARRPDRSALEPCVRLTL
jgi:acid phosphatase type 7